MKTKQTVRQQLRLPRALAETIADQARQQEISKSELVRRAVAAYNPELEHISEQDLTALLRELRAVMRIANDRLDALIARIEAWPEERAAERAEARAETEVNPEAIEALGMLLSRRADGESGGSTRAPGA
jgi:aspartate oxidase